MASTIPADHEIVATCASFISAKRRNSTDHRRVAAPGQSGFCQIRPSMKPIAVATPISTTINSIKIIDIFLPN